MNIQQLRLFSDVVRFGSVNKAAQANYTSPSTLSRSIRELEKNDPNCPVSPRARWNAADPSG